MANKGNKFDSKILFTLIQEERRAIADKQGDTPLSRKARELADLDVLKPVKVHAEKAVADLSEYFQKFDETDFTNLEMFIQESQFAKDQIKESYFNFIKTEKDKLDLFVYANLVRFVQRLSPNQIDLAIIESIHQVEKDDPWLFAEILIEHSWKNGIDYIKNLLSGETYDASYLFSMFPDWKLRKSKEEIEMAFSVWYDCLLPEDKKIAEYYSINNGFRINNKRLSDITPIITDFNDSVPQEYFESENKFETLPC